MALTGSVGQLTSLGGVSSGIPSALLPTPIPDWLDRVKNAQTPLLQLVSKASPPDRMSNILTWGWSSERVLNDQLAAGYTSGGTTLTVDNQSRFQVNDIIMIEAEIFYVTAYVSTNQLTVVGGQAGTTPANHADNTGIQILANAHLQNGNTTLVPIAQGELLTNQWQQIEYKLASSQQSENFDSFENAGKGTRLKYFAKKLMNIEAPKQFERALIRNLSQAQTATVPGIFGGINQPAYTQNRVTVSGALTVKALMDALQATYMQSADPADMVMMTHPSMARRISSWFSGMREAGATDDTVRLHFEKFITPFGTLHLVPNMNWLQGGTVDGTPEKELNAIMIANFKDFEIVPQSSSSTWQLGFRPELTNDAWQQVAYLRGIYSLRAKNIFTRTYISGYSVLDADYAGMI